MVRSDLRYGKILDEDVSRRKPRKILSARRRLHLTWNSKHKTPRDSFQRLYGPVSENLCSRLIFMAYSLDITLTQSWPQLSHEGKFSIRPQVNNISHRLWTVRQKGSKKCSAVREFEITSLVNVLVPKPLPQRVSSAIYSFPHDIKAVTLTSGSFTPSLITISRRWCHNQCSTVAMFRLTGL